mmetsp:Transcript_29339/g.66395  ORF Transcript_29339/g.66395 Transcript_29339/m.66395 type:complete len:218 (-) Transcript_29339:509-1162(-)
MLALIFAEADGVSVLRCAAVSCGWRACAETDDVWRPLTLRCALSAMQRSPWGARTEDLQPVCDRSRDAWRDRYRLLVGGVCSLCSTRVHCQPSEPVDGSGNGQVTRPRANVCTACARAFCGRCGANRQCASRCAECGGDAFCSICDELSAAPAPTVWCSCCLICCSSCGLRVCCEHAKGTPEAATCCDCVANEYTDFMVTRAQAWPALYGAEHHSIY